MVLAREVWQIELWCRRSQRQAGRRTRIAKCQCIQPFLQIVQPQQDSTVLAKQLPTKPANRKQGSPRHQEGSDHMIRYLFLQEKSENITDFGRDPPPVDP